MNCGTSEYHRIARAVSELLKTFQDEHCANCGASLSRLYLYGNAYHCGECLAAVCVVCGCTDEVACAPKRCHWIGPGLCSAHAAELDASLARSAQPRSSVVRPLSSL